MKYLNPRSLGGPANYAHMKRKLKNLRNKHKYKSKDFSLYFYKLQSQTQIKTNREFITE